MNAVEIAKKIRAVLGIVDPPGSCRDCGGDGVVPNTDIDVDNLNPGWTTCPTCHGSGMGGLA